MLAGTVQIMWMEILILFAALYGLRVLMDLYIVRTYRKLFAMHGTVPAEVFREKAQRHIRLSGIFAVGPWNQRIYKVYNGLCWMLASDHLTQNEEDAFLFWLSRIRKEETFELKAFILALYYRAKHSDDAAHHFYGQYLRCRHEDQNVSVIMHGIFDGADHTQEAAFAQAVKAFRNPAVIRLLDENGIGNHEAKP